MAQPNQTFCLAMCHRPEYQHLIYDEIDRVVGDTRMQRASDLPDMPVTRAFIRETMFVFSPVSMQMLTTARRWRPPIPTGIPHYVDQDDEYEGYHIPKDSLVLALERSIGRDPHLYPDPDECNPVR